MSEPLELDGLIVPERGDEPSPEPVPDVMVGLGERLLGRRDLPGQDELL